MDSLRAAIAAPRHRAMVGYVGLLVASHAIAAATPLTLADAQRLALQRSTQLVARQSAVEAARDMAVAAARLPDPVAKLQLNNLPIDGEDRFSLTRDFMTMLSVGLMQEFTHRDKRNAGAARFEREADKSAIERLADIAAIERDTAVAWLDRRYAEAMAAVTAEQGEAARAEVDAAEAAYRAGRGNLADILAARSTLSGFDDRASEIGRRVSTAKIALARWIGDAADAPLAGSPDVDALRIDSRTLDTDILHHPQVAVLEQRERVAVAEVDIAKAARKADWSVEVMYSQRGSAYSNMISVGVSVPLQWDRTNRQDRELAARLAMLEEARAEREDALRAHAAEIRAMLAEWQNHRERRARFERELLPLARERTEAVLAAYRGSKASIAEVLMARRGEIDVRIQALQLEWDTARLWAQLNFLSPEDGAVRSAAGISTKDSR